MKQKLIKDLIKELLLLTEDRGGMPKLPGRGRPPKDLRRAIDIINNAPIIGSDNDDGEEEDKVAPPPPAAAALVPSRDKNNDAKKYKFQEPINPEHKTGDFDLAKYLQLKTPRQRLDYAREASNRNPEQFKYLGAGSSRIVYDIPGQGKVLKLALNNKGVAQNQEELAITNKVHQAYPAYPIVTKIFGHDDLGEPTWLISEFAKELRSREEFYRLTGIEFEKIYGLLRYMKNPNVGYEPNTEQAKNPFYKALKAIEDFGFNSGDLSVIGHWGTTEDGRVVILDYGFTEAVAAKHYGREGNTVRFEGKKLKDAHYGK